MSALKVSVLIFKFKFFMKCVSFVQTTIQTTLINLIDVVNHTV